MDWSLPRCRTTLWQLSASTSHWFDSFATAVDWMFSNSSSPQWDLYHKLLHIVYLCFSSKIYTNIFFSSTRFVFSRSEAELSRQLQRVMKPARHALTWQLELLGRTGFATSLGEVIFFVILIILFHILTVVRIQRRWFDSFFYCSCVCFSLFLYNFSTSPASLEVPTTCRCQSEIHTNSSMAGRTFVKTRSTGEINPQFN